MSSRGGAARSPRAPEPVRGQIMFRKSLLALGVMLVAGARPLHAAEGGLLAPTTGLMFWTIVTFVIVLVILWKVALPPILGAVEAREKQLRELLASAAADR